MPHITIDGPAIEAALNKLVGAYPGGQSEIWIKFDSATERFTYATVQWQSGQHDVTASFDTPNEAVERMIADFKPVTPEQHRANRLAQLRAELAKLEGEAV